MMREEFDRKLEEIRGTGSRISDEDYKLIECIYTFHPCISETDGKRQVALLYHEFGMQIFKDMLTTATRNQMLEAEILKTRQKLQRLLDEADALRKGAEI